MSDELNLDAGDFLYQSGQELFLCVAEDHDDSILFAVHGWREIDKDRVQDYIDSDKSTVHRQQVVEDIVEEEGDDDTKRQFNKLKQLFAVYEDGELPEDGPHEQFKLEE